MNPVPNLKTVKPIYIVRKITQTGFGIAPGQIPNKLRVPFMLFDYLNDKKAAQTAKPKSRYLKEQLKAITKEKTNSTFRCSREGFVPFDVNGHLLQSARKDGIPLIGPKVSIDEHGNILRAPLYLVLDMRDEFIAALSVLYTLADGSLKLEYLCAAKKFPKAGTKLLNFISTGTFFRKVVPVHVFTAPRRVFLNDNSGIPNYYKRKGFTYMGPTETGQYMTKEFDKTTGKLKLVNKILNVYKKSMNKPATQTKPTDEAKKKQAKHTLTKKPVTRVMRQRINPLPAPKTPRYVLRQR